VEGAAQLINLGTRQGAQVHALDVYHRGGRPSYPLNSRDPEPVRRSEDEKIVLPLTGFENLYHPSPTE
jgi:hypothetical protein